MVDITHKKNTLRIATAEALLTVSKKETIQAIQNKTVPKGDVFEMSRAAGLLGVKKKHPKFCPIATRCPLNTLVLILKSMVYKLKFRAPLKQSIKQALK